jgi:deoxycytidylate deaminase
MDYTPRCHRRRSHHHQTPRAITRRFALFHEFYRHGISTCQIGEWDMNLHLSQPPASIMHLNSISKYIDYLIRLAHKSDIYHKHAAAIFLNKRPILFTINTRHGNNSKHAEENAINRLASLIPKSKGGKGRRGRYQLVVIRISGGGHVVANSHPCPRCTKLIKNTPCIDRVYFSCSIPK